MAQGKSPDPSERSRETTHRLSVPDPEAIGLPRAKRSYALPLALALVVFVGLILVRLVWD